MSEDVVERLRAKQKACKGNRRQEQWSLYADAISEITRLRASTFPTGYAAAREDAARVVERWSLPTIQTPSMWLVDQAGIASLIRSMPVKEKGD